MITQISWVIKLNIEMASANIQSGNHVLFVILSHVCADQVTIDYDLRSIFRPILQNYNREKVNILEFMLNEVQMNTI